MSSSTSRRRAVVEMMVCALLVATLAVQPALGDKGRGHGGDTPAAADAQAAVPPPASNSGPGSQGGAPSPAAAPSRNSGSGPQSGSGGRRGPGSVPVAAPTDGNRESPGRGRGRGRGRGDSAPVVAPAPPPPPAPVEVDDRQDDPRDDRQDDPRDDRQDDPRDDRQDDPRDDGQGRGRNRGERPAPDNALAPPSNSGPSRDVTPDAAQPATPPADTAAPETTAPAAATTSPPAAPAAGAAPLGSPASGATAGTQPRTATPGRRPSAGGGRPGSASARGVAPPGTLGDLAGTAGAPAGVTATPATSLSVPLATPATAAIERAGVREAGRTTSSEARSREAADVPALGPTIVEKVVENVVGVIPMTVWIALAGLGAMVLALGAHSLYAAGRTRRLERQRERLMEDIGLLQAALLPAVPSRIGALLTTVAYRPADGPAAGGDFYDAFPLSEGRVGLLLGDVSGHGRQALAKTALVRHSVRAHLMAGMSPREAIAVTGRALDGQLADDFATVLAAVHDPATGTLTYASAGHPPPVVLGPPAHTPVTASSAPPIGVGFPTGQRQTVLPMPAGATVAVYSDGLLEARVDGVPLGTKRLAAWLAELGPEATARQLLDLVVERADSVPDDLAAIVLHAAPGATAPAARIEQLKLDVLDVEGPDLDGFLEGAGVPRSERSSVGRRVSEQLAVSGGVIVEVMTGEHPKVTVAPIGDRARAAAAHATPAR